jgi:hypothetical protein
MHQRDLARYGRALEAVRAQLIARDHDAGSFAIDRTSDPTEDSGIASERMAPAKSARSRSLRNV